MAAFLILKSSDGNRQQFSSRHPEVRGPDFVEFTVGRASRDRVLDSGYSPRR
jgi:hypothetical protein